MKKVFFNPGRDLQILHFIWKWKVATTSAIHAKFFAGKAPVTAYNRLWQLKAAGFLESKFDITGTSRMWGLAAKGFAAVLPHLLPLREQGFRSEYIDHDLLVMAAHLGDCLSESDLPLENFSEQELRRLDPEESYPSWVPRLDLHRPDGYWRTKTGPSPRVIALEVELSVKKASDYRKAGDFYRLVNQIDRVVWIVRTDSLIKKIHENVSCQRHGANDLHNFIRLKDLFASGWQACICEGPDKERSIRSFLLNVVPSSPPQAQVKPSPSRGSFHLLTQSRIRRFNLASYTDRRKSVVLD